MSTVAVATDSSACLPPELAEAWGVFVAPLQVIVDEKAYDEGIEIAPDVVVAALLDGRRVSTSQPGPAALTDGVEQLHRIVLAWSRAHG